MSLEKAFSRRSFLAAAASAGALGWLHDSDHIAARSLRGTLAGGSQNTAQPVKPSWRDWPSSAITAAWIGHETVLIDFQGLRILTDPVLFDWVGLDLGPVVIGEKRLVAPALKVDELPPIDLILLSHAHMDHLDLPTLRALPRESRVLTAARTEDLVRGCGHSRVQELRWGESALVSTANGELEARAFEVKHTGARWKHDPPRGCNAYLLTRNGHSLIFGGDTALCGSFQQCKASKPVAAIMPIGSYGRSPGSHCTPEQAIRMANEAGAEYFLPVHHGTFALGKEPLSEPLERAEAAIEADRIGFRRPGETWRFFG